MGFFRRYKTYPVTIEALVFPMPIPCAFPALSGENLTGQTTGTLKGEMGDETKELREYRSSDPVKWIDWKATARKGQMITRDFYYLEGDTLSIDLSKKGNGWEKKLSEACYLVIEGDRKKLSVSMILPERQIGPGRGEKHKKKLLEALALA